MVSGAIRPGDYAFTFSKLFIVVLVQFSISLGRISYSFASFTTWVEGVHSTGFPLVLSEQLGGRGNTFANSRGRARLKEHEMVFPSPIASSDGSAPCEVGDVSIPLFVVSPATTVDAACSNLVVDSLLLQSVEATVGSSSRVSIQINENGNSVSPTADQFSSGSQTPITSVRGLSSSSTADIFMPTWDSSVPAAGLSINDFSPMVSPHPVVSPVNHLSPSTNLDSSAVDVCPSKGVENVHPMVTRGKKWYTKA
ncbi:hypothetical protein V6N11_012409 [Hibiscus sabdariffa]|uniref:Uncharacterized protein n=1 Tax=Hibiscus sabdariffa TaxID=183260 RepID=A0ABR2QB13_9ROSI